MIYDHPLLERAYRASPVALQHLFVTGYGLLKWRERHSATFRRYLAELEATQWWPRDRLAALQADRLQALVRHCYDTVPYYRRIFDERGLRPVDIREPADLYKLPVLTKQDVRAYRAELRSRAVPDARVTTGRTGGTTGIPLHFALDKDRVTFDHALVHRHWGWAGWRPGEWVVLLRGFTLVPPGETDGPLWRYDWIDRRIYLSGFHLSHATMGRYVEQLRRWAPRFIAAYPSSIFTLARYMDTIDATIPVEAVFTGSESVSEVERRTIERRFGKVYDRYGTGERLVVGQQCAEGNYHQNVEFGILQVDRTRGEPAATGEAGELIHTGLTNLSMPLLRYASEDVGYLRDEACPCGRPLPLMGAVEGRKDDVIVTADGRLMPRAGLDQIHEFVERMERCQLLQREPGAVVIRVLPRPGFCADDEAELARQLRKRVGDTTRITVEVVDDLPLTVTGKHRFIVSELEPARFAPPTG